MDVLFGIHSGCVLGVCGNGSLMGRPCFAYVEKIAATLHGARRAFCIYSVHHRGTPERPGPVRVLAPWGAARGMVYRDADDAWPQVYAYLLEREQPTEPYIEATRMIRLDDGRRVQTMALMSAQAPPQGAGALHLE